MSAAPADLRRPSCGPIAIAVRNAAPTEENAIARSATLLIAASLLLATVAAAQSQPPEIRFSVRRDGEFIETAARVDLPVPAALAWGVLTDYERYPRFISSLRESRIESRDAQGIVVRQKGSFAFLFFSQDIEVRLLVSEFPPSVIESRALDGDFRVMDGRYELAPSGGTVRLSYAGRLLPNFSLPPIFDKAIVRYILLRNFRQMVDEIVRRDAAVRSAVGANQ